MELNKRILKINLENKTEIPQFDSADLDYGMFLRILKLALLFRFFILTP